MLRCLAVFLFTHALAQAAVPEAVVRVGDESPFGRPFSGFLDPVIDDTGAIGFVGTSTGVFRRVGSTIDGLLVAGDPTTGGRTVASVGPPEPGEPGCVAFVAGFVGGSGGIVRFCDGVATVVAEIGSLGPGALPITTFGPSIAHGLGGEIATVVGLADGTTALLRYVGTTALEVARSGTPAPTGGSFIDFRPVGVTATGNVAFSATVLTGPDGLFQWDANSLRVTSVVVANSPSPGRGRFLRIGNASMNVVAQIAFRATTEQGGAGVFRVDAATPAASITVLAEEKGKAPVTEPKGERTAVFRAFPTSIRPSINAGGQVAFRALLGESEYNAGVFIAAPRGELDAAVIAGQTGALVLSRLRDPEIADDGSLLLPASEPGAGSGLYVVRNGRPSEWLPTAALTSAGTGFRFVTGRGRERAEDAFALGQREGVFIATTAGVSKVAVLDDPSPLQGRFSGFDALAAGPAGLAFRATIDAGRSSEAVLRFDNSGLRVVSRTDRRVRGGKVVSFLGGLIEPVVPLQAEGVGIAFQALLQQGRGASGIFLAGRGGTRPLALAGQRADRGRLSAFGSFDVGSNGTAAFAATRSGAASPAVLLRQRGRLRTAAAAGADTSTRAVGKFTAFDGVDIGPAGIAFRATFGDLGGEGLFVADKQGVGAVVLTQDPTPGGGRFVTVGLPAVTADGVMFVAGIAGETSKAGLFHAAVTGVPTPDQIPPATALLTLGQVLSEGTVVRIGQPRANQSGAAVFPVDLTGGQTVQALYRLAATR
jgi:hypothetical protein